MTVIEAEEVRKLLAYVIKAYSSTTLLRTTFNNLAIYEVNRPYRLGCTCSDNPEYSRAKES